MSSSSHVGSLLPALILEHPYFTAVSLFVLLCLFTRIRTGREAQYSALGEGTSNAARSAPIVPYWIPLVGHTISFGAKYTTFLQTVANSVPSGIFGIRVAGQTHNVIVSPSLSKELLVRTNLPMDFDTIIFRFLGLVFGDRGAFKEFSDTHGGLWDIHKPLSGLMREPFLSEGTQRIVDAIEARIYNLVSGNASWVDQSLWERAGRVQIMSDHSQEKGFVAEATLQELMRNFVGDIASATLMGQCFVDNNPNALKDLWLLDEKINTLMLGLPWWLMPGMGPVIAARERLIEAVAEHHMAMANIIDGKDPGSRYDDMSDVSSVIWERVRAFKKMGIVEPRTYGCGNLTVLWAMNVNANQVAFWVLYYLYSQPELLKQIRDEIRPYVEVHQSNTGLPIGEAPKLKMDINSLVFKCPLLKGTLLETMRFEVSPAFYRTANEDFVLNESPEDAKILGKSTAESYRIKKGDIVCVSFISQQQSPVWYSDPKKFDPKRHWVKKTNEKGEEQISVEYGNLRIWGGGKTMCKGRNFAEREVIAFVVGTIMMWEMEPVDGSGWKHPGRKPTAGAYRATDDLRVRMWRRKY